MRMSRRQSLAALAGGAGLLAGSPLHLARAASGLAGSTSSAPPSLALAAGLDVHSPAAIAFLREMGVNTAPSSTIATLSGSGIAHEPRFAPVPAIAHGPSIPPDGYLVGEIRGGLY